MAAGGVSVVVDVANVMGSQPNGWWRDRVGAAQRLLGELAGLPGRELTGPQGSMLTVLQVVAVVEGRARAVTDPDADGLRVVRAEQDGDTAMVAEAYTLAAATGAPARVLVVTADRGLRARLPLDCAAAGPRWLLTNLRGSPHG